MDKSRKIYPFHKKINCFPVAALTGAILDDPKDNKFYQSFCDMIVFEALMWSTDRHFDLLIDNRTNMQSGFAPVFDNGMVLFPFAMEEN